MCYRRDRVRGPRIRSSVTGRLGQRGCSRRHLSSGEKISKRHWQAEPTCSGATPTSSSRARYTHPWRYGMAVHLRYAVGRVVLGLALGGAVGVACEGRHPIETFYYGCWTLAEAEGRSCDELCEEYRPGQAVCTTECASNPDDSAAYRFEFESQCHVTHRPSYTAVEVDAECSEPIEIPDTELTAVQCCCTDAFHSMP